MPHAVIEGADACPDLAGEVLERVGGILHKVVEVAEVPSGWLLKSLIVEGGSQTRFLTRVDRREEGLLVHIDDHMYVERAGVVFEHLALITKRVLEANPNATLGRTNLADRIAALKH